MKTRLILVCAVLGLAISALGQSTSNSTLPDAPSATIAPKPTPPAPQPAKTPAQSPETQQNTQPAQQPAAEEPLVDTQAQPQQSDEGQKPQQQPASQPSSAPGQQSTSSQKPGDLTPDPDVPTEKIVRIVNEVNVVFTVTDKHGRFVKDLKKDDIKVLDDNKPQVIRSFRAETDLPLRVGLLIDASNSIRDRFKFEQEAAIEFLNQIIRQKKDQAFVIGFDTVWDLTQDFTGDLDKLTKGVKVIRPGGGTALWDAVFYACRDKLMKEKETGPVRKAIILVSDGDDNQSRVLRQEAIEMAQRAGVIVYTISTNLSNNPDEGDRSLKMLAETTGGQAFFPFKLQDVANAFHDSHE